MVSFNKIADLAIDYPPLSCTMMEKANNLDNDYFGDPKKQSDVKVFGYKLWSTTSTDWSKVRIFIFSRLVAIPAAITAVVDTALSVSAFALAFLVTLITLGQIEGSKKLLESLFLRTCASTAMIPISIISILIPSLNLK